MQRIGMMLAEMGPCHVLMAARRGPLEARDIAIGAGILVLGSMVGASVAIRQILLHILPGDPGFSTPILGLHLYTWAFIAFACNIAAAGIQLAALAWYRPDPRARSPLAGITTAVLAAVIVTNILSVIAEAGFAWGLPSDPVGYLLFQGEWSGAVAALPHAEASWCPAAAHALLFAARANPARRHRKVR